MLMCWVGKVVSLPMRDGNLELGQVSAPRDLVVSLPMRDGNREAWIDSSRAFLLLAYL